MNNIKIINNTGVSSDTKILINGTEVHGCISKIELGMEPGEIVKANLTVIVSGIIIDSNIEAIDIKEIKDETKEE